PHLDLAPVEQALAAALRIAVEQPGIDPYPAVAFARAAPVGEAAAGRAMVQRDHPVAPNVGHGLAFDPDCAVVGIIGHHRADPAAEAAIAPAEPLGRARHLDLHRPAVA